MQNLLLLWLAGRVFPEGVKIETTNGLGFGFVLCCSVMHFGAPLFFSFWSYFSSENKNLQHLPNSSQQLWCYWKEHCVGGGGSTAVTELWKDTVRIRRESTAVCITVSSGKSGDSSFAAMCLLSQMRTCFVHLFRCLESCYYISNGINKKDQCHFMLS